LYPYLNELKKVNLSISLEKSNNTRSNLLCYSNKKTRTIWKRV